MSLLKNTTDYIIAEFKNLPTSSLDLMHSDKDKEFLNVVTNHSKNLNDKDQLRLKNEFFCLWAIT